MYGVVVEAPPKVFAAVEAGGDEGERLNAALEGGNRLMRLSGPTSTDHD